MGYFCYLLQSQDRKKAYVGFTVTPRRRLRQHNAEIKGGAYKTSKYHWSHVCIVSGFPNKIVALQFEWQWQHPNVSRLLKDRNNKIITKKTIDISRSCKATLLVLYSLLTTPLWQQLDLTVNFIDETAQSYFALLVQKKGNTPLRHLFLTSNDVDTMHNAIPNVISAKHISYPPINSKCVHCDESLHGNSRVSCCTSVDCGSYFHLLCAATIATSGSQVLMPIGYRCTNCHTTSKWVDIVRINHFLCKGCTSVGSESESESESESPSMSQGEVSSTKNNDENEVMLYSTDDEAADRKWSEVIDLLDE